MEKIVIEGKSEIVENNELNPTEKLILFLSYTFSKSKLGYTVLTNKEIGEIFSINENTIGKYRKKLVERGYEVKEKNKYYLTDKYLEVNPKSKRDLKIPYEVYSKKISSGSKLLWGEHNSLSNRGKIESFASREYLSNRLNCSIDSITNWTNELIESDLLSDYNLVGSGGSRQRRVKTIDFSKGSNNLIQVSLERRKEIWEEFIGSKSSLKQQVTSIKSASEFVKDLYVNIQQSDNKREVVSSLRNDVENKIKGSILLDKLRDYILVMLKEINF